MPVDEVRGEIDGDEVRERFLDVHGKTSPGVSRLSSVHRRHGGLT